MHDSITVHQEIILTPYLARPHDHQLRELLIRAKKSDRPAFLLVVGTSCTGKTRTLYEAVTAVLPDWQLTAPRHDNVLVRLLMDGIPSRTIVWLDELQDLLPGTPEGIRAAKAIVEMLNATVGPILFASTIWPTNHAAMQARPEPDKAATGVGAIPHLLTRVSIIEVPGIFTDADLPDEPELDDPRLRKARDAAARTEHGRKITQVLAGGTQLVDRLYPPKDSQATDRFSPSASAVLRAAADLRRVGLPNPIPRWAIEGAAAGYLDPPD
ncbi:MAG: hypothetical protein L0H79_19015, partial [Intrasporangium sp.]|uniref:hypothetical protein n=1 Tax=Intrasporangium sp. TaxID=1925024 RepID=UPI0026485EF0